MDIMKTIEAAVKEGMTHFGLRKHHESCAVGDYLGVSFDDFDGAEPVELEGLSTVGLDYDGFGGILADYGNDDGELLIANAKCIGVL